MNKITMNINGMACGMCESHINDAIRNTFSVKKVSSSYKKGISEIITENELDESKLKEVIEKTGYEVLNITVAPFEKKLFSFLKNRFVDFITFTNQILK